MVPLTPSPMPRVFVFGKLLKCPKIGVKTMSEASSVMSSGMLTRLSLGANRDQNTLDRFGS